MDPLSISVSILAIIGSVTATIKAAKTVYNAPEELESLLNDLTDAEIMIHDVKFHLEEHKQPFVGAQEQLLWERLADAEDVLVKLRSILSEVLGKPDASKNIQRFEWFRAKKKTRKLMKKLSKVHDELPRRLGQVEGSRIRLELKNLSLVQMQMTSGLSVLEREIGGAAQNLTLIHEDSDLTHQLQEQTNFNVEVLRRDSLQHHKRVESVLAMNNDLLQMLPGMPELQNRGPQQCSVGDPKPFYNSSEPQPLPMITNVNTPSRHQSIMIQTQYQRPGDCESTCQCHCHIRKTINTPSFFSSLLGQVFVGYRGLPVVSSQCTNISCKRASEPKFLATYFFPEWWVKDRMILLAMRWTFNRGPELILRFPGRHSMNDPVILSIQQGNTDKLKLYLSSGKACPNDLRVAGGSVWSLSFLAFHCRNLNTFRFLVEIGADTNVEDSDGNTIEDIACREVLIGKFPHEFSQWIEALFMSRRSDNFGFSALHSAVIGSNNTPIDELFPNILSIINTQDFWGWTPLHWASAKGDLKIVTKLLELGADPNIPNKLGQFSLEAALTGGAVNCAIQLLKHNANAHYTTKRGWNTLHFALRYSADTPVLLQLISTLFYLGLDANLPNSDGYTPFLVAVQENNHSAIRWLLNHGADYGFEHEGSTILHFIGWFGDMETIQIFRGACLRGVDVERRNSVGESALDQIFDVNREVLASGEHLQSFQELLAEIEGRTKKVLKIPVGGDGILDDGLSTRIVLEEKAGDFLEEESVDSIGHLEGEDEVVFYDCEEGSEV